MNNRYKITNKKYNTHKLLKLLMTNVEIPEGYQGYYFSYEKFEAQRRVTGLLTRNDFRSQDNEAYNHKVV